MNQNRNNQVFNVLADGSLFVRGGRGKDEIGFSIVSKSGGKNELKIAYAASDQIANCGKLALLA